MRSCSNAVSGFIRYLQNRKPWADNQCVITAFLLHAFCSSTADGVQRYCKYVCSDTATVLQWHCTSVAVVLQWVIGVFFAVLPFSLHTFGLFMQNFLSLQPNFTKNRYELQFVERKRGIIFGALNEQSIAWKVAEKAVKEGATITLSNTPVAVRMGEVSALSEKLNCEVIPADATSVEDLENVFKRSMEVLGGPVDFVLHSIGMSPNVRKKRTYDDLDYDMLEKTLDISAVSFHKMIQAAKKLNAIADYGSILALSYVAAQRTFYGYNDMADAKALLESIARSFGYIYGREHHVRVNTISQSPTMTTAGSGVKGMDKLFDFANRMSPLGNASADECADYCIVMFSDLTRKVTMQNLFHDGGFSSVGMSLRAMATYEKGLDEYKDENGNIIYG